MPEAAVGFWIIRIVVTALGWTAASVVVPSLALTSINSVPRSFFFVGPVAAAAVAGLAWVQLNSRHFDRWIYWLTMLAATVCGAIVASLVELTNGSGYPVAAAALLVCLAVVLAIWQKSLGAIAVDKVATADVMTLYWLATVFAQALGVELAHNVAATGVGYAGAAGIFGIAVAILAYVQHKGLASSLALFWAASVLSCPIGVGLADFLLEPLGHGGLALTTGVASAVLGIATATLVYVLPQKSARQEEKRSKA